MNLKYMKISKSNRFDLQRKVVSHMTSLSWQQTPHVAYHYEPDITDFYEEYQKLTRERSSKISFNTIMLKTIAEGLLKAPNLNSYLEYNQKKGEGTLHILEEINIAVPWLLPDGRMITPTIINAGKMSLEDISCYMLNLAERISKTNIDEMLYQTMVTYALEELSKLHVSMIPRIAAAKLGSGRMKPLSGKAKTEYDKIPQNLRLTDKDLLSGTVTVSNIGPLYKEQKGFFSLLEIIPPQVFAIGLSSIQEKPGIFTQKNGKKEIAIRKFLPMCLVFDHRAIDFNSIIPFLKQLDKVLIILILFTNGEIRIPISVFL